MSKRRKHAPHPSCSPDSHRRCCPDGLRRGDIGRVCPVVQSPGSLLSGFSQAPQVRESLRSSALVRSRAFTEESFPAIDAGHVRVVIESDTPLTARTAIEAAGGTVERSWRNLVQADVPASSVAALDRQGSVDSVRAPYRHREYAVSGEEVAVSLAPAWHAKGFTGKGVKVAIIDGGFVGLADRQAAGDAARQRRHAGLLRRAGSTTESRARHGRGRDRPRDRTGRPALSDLRRHGGRPRGG